jgi:hypothetical protein
VAVDARSHRTRDRARRIRSVMNGGRSLG